MKVVINKCYGGFGLSREALHELRKMGHKAALAETDIGEKWPDSNEIREQFLDSFLKEIDRNDPMLLELIERLGSERVSSPLAELVVINIPDDVKWHIEEYDGVEWIAEDHKTWH